MSSPFIQSSPDTKANNVFTSKTLTKNEKLDLIDNYMLNLEIISHIKEYDKLSVVNKQMSIDTPSYIQCLIRRWYGEGRNETLDAITGLINEIFQLTDELLNDEREKRRNNQFNVSFDIETNTNRIRNFKDTNSDILTKIMINLDKSIGGLQNLKITYLGDISITSQLDIIISKIQNRCDKIKKLLVIREN
jgi:hypothetical protein